MHPGPSRRPCASENRSSESSGPQCPNETIYEGAAEIIRACRLVSLRIEEGVYKTYMDEEEDKKKEQIESID